MPYQARTPAQPLAHEPSGRAESRMHRAVVPVRLGMKALRYREARSGRCLAVRWSQRRKQDRDNNCRAVRYGHPPGRQRSHRDRAGPTLERRLPSTPQAGGSLSLRHGASTTPGVGSAPVTPQAPRIGAPQANALVASSVVEVVLSTVHLPRNGAEDRNRGRQWPPAKGWRLAHRRIAGRRAARAGFASRSADARPEGKPIGRVRASPTLGMKGSLQSCRVSVPSGSTPWRPGSASRFPPSSSRRPPRCCCARATSRMPPRTAGWISTLPGSEPESGESRRRREALGGNRKTAVRAARRDPARDGSYRSCPSQGSSLAA